MVFTQEDYIKIQQWLSRNSIKDTEFNEANIPFNGEEIVTIVQGNQNKKVFLRDLASQLVELGVSDFINITEKYNAPNISLEEAIRLIPSRARKEGQVITFLDSENNWHIYQFKGSLIQWNILDQWEDLFNWEKLIIDSILPDEEDLTKSLPDESGNSYLSLKDRAYNPEDFSGLGRIILRKNIVEVEDPIYGKVKKNILYQDIFTQSNTIYEIRYDFDLNSKEITIPEGCLLDFQGGSFSNGIIVGNKTKISGVLTYSIFNDCVVKNFNLPYIDIRWTGAVSDCDIETGIGTDNSDAIQKAIDNILNYHLSTYLYISGCFYIGKSIITPCLMIKGDNPIGFDWGYNYSKDYKFKHSSALFIAENITAFEVTGYNRVESTTTYSYIEIENLHITSVKNSKSSIFFHCTASGFPSRPGWIEKVSAENIDKVCFFELVESHTQYYTFILSKCFITHCNHSLWAKSYNNKSNIGGFTIKDSVLEQGARIYIEIPFGPINIENNLFEGQTDTITIKCNSANGISISKNYFELNTGNIIKINAVNSIIHIFHNYFENCADGIINITGDGSPTTRLRAYDNYGWDIQNVKFKCYAIYLDSLDPRFKNEFYWYLNNTDRINVDEIIPNSTIILPIVNCVHEEIKSAPEKGITVQHINALSNPFNKELYINPVGKVIQVAYISESDTMLSPSTYKITPQVGDKICISVYVSKDCQFTVRNLHQAVYKTFQLRAGVNLLTFDVDGTINEFMLFAQKSDTPYYISIPVFYHISKDYVSNVQIDDVKGIIRKLSAKTGGTGYRHKTPDFGDMYFDTTLNKPIWWTGTKWVDAAGAEV